MSKTNHRINRDREGRESESQAHKSRRDAKRLVDTLAESYTDFEEAELEEFIYDEYEVFEKIRKRR